MKELDITQAKARTLSKKLCNDFNIPECRIWFISINDPDCLAWYSEKRPNMFAYIMIEKCWSRKLVLVLHELTHHLQEELYPAEDTPHGQTFSQAKSRVATWARNNISNNFDWEALITRFTSGRRKCKRKTKKMK